MASKMGFDFGNAFGFAHVKSLGEAVVTHLYLNVHQCYLWNHHSFIPHFPSIAEIFSEG